MKCKNIIKINFLVIAIVVNLFLIFVYIYKQNLIISLSSKNQKLEKMRSNLVENINKLTHEIVFLENKSQAKNYAKKINMEKIKPDQIKRIESE